MLTKGRRSTRLRPGSTPSWPDEIRQAYVQKFALAYCLIVLSFSLFFTPQSFNPYTAIPVNILLFMIGTPYWFRRAEVPHYWLNLTSQICNAGASLWICAYLGPTSHINLVAIPQLVLALMMFRRVHPKTTAFVTLLCLLQLILPLFPVIQTRYLHKRMKEPGLELLRLLIDVTVFGLTTYQFQIISEAWTKLLERIEEEKDRYQNQNEWRKKLLRILSHDIKEPMVHSLLAARNLKKKVSEAEAAVVNQIESAQISIKEMITNVELSNQEVDSGQAAQVRSPRVSHSIESVIQKLGPWFESRIREKGLSLVIQNSSHDHTLQASSDVFVYQVVMNLLSNAVKFSPVGATIEFESGRGPNGETLWTLTDCGTGISADAFVSHPTPQPGTQGERGSGLGLKIAQSFAKDNSIELVWASPKLDPRHPLCTPPEKGTRVVLIQQGALL